MATTWNMLPRGLNGAMLTITVQEVIDTVPGKTYSVTRPRSHGKALFRKDLKRKILADRKQIADAVADPGINMAGFEAFLNA